MLKVYCNNDVYVKKIIAQVVHRWEEADVAVYVLTEDMSATDLMKAFRACRVNPLKSYFYIPNTESEFSGLAFDAIHRGTLRIYDNWDTLCASLTESYTASYESAVLNCVTVSLSNWGISLGQNDIASIKGVILDSMCRYGAYVCSYAWLCTLQSGKVPSVGQYMTVLKSVLTVYAAMEWSVDNYRNTRSHFLSLLASNKISKTSVNLQKEFDSMTVHVLFRPFTVQDRDISSRKDSIIRVAYEHIL